MQEARHDFARLLAEARDGVHDNYRKHGNPSFSRMLEMTGFDRRWIRGEGALLFDDAGRAYVDCIAGYAVHGIGRSHPDMVAALHEALASGAPNWVQFERNPLAALLARRLSERTPGGLDRVFFSNSGTEAVECAIKLARRATGRGAVLHCDMAFHGLTIGALAANGNAKLREGFGPLGESDSIPFDDLHALERALATHRFAAFLVEPVQGKTCRAASNGYLAEASRLCRRFGTLLVIDEVQTGVGRTGRFLALEHDPGCRPDMVVLSKALAGGYVPIGATLVRSDIWAATFGRISHALVHSSTFQGGILAMTAGLITLEIHDRERLSERAERLGVMLRTSLERHIGPYCGADEIRGRGLMLGVALRKSAAERFLSGLPFVGPLERLAFGQAFVMEMLAKHAVLCQVTESHSDVLKLTPPIVIAEAQCMHVLSALDATLGKLGAGAAASIHGIAHAARNWRIAQARGDD